MTILSKVRSCDDDTFTSEVKHHELAEKGPLTAQNEEIKQGGIINYTTLDLYYFTSPRPFFWSG
jgi:hypothetical protein